MAGALSGPARAQISGSLGIESDYRLRSYSISEGRPTATAQLGYDDHSGLYANLTVGALMIRGHPRLLGTQANIGYSRRLGPDLAVDAGLLRADYRRAESGLRRRNYTQAYVGITARRISARLFYSPDYYYDRASAIYGEVETYFEPAPDWRFNAHLGALAYLSAVRPYPASRGFQQDWQLTLTRSFHGVEIHSAVSGGGPGEDYYRGHKRERTALTAGASWAF